MGACCAINWISNLELEYYEWSMHCGQDTSLIRLEIIHKCLGLKLGKVELSIVILNWKLYSCIFNKISGTAPQWGGGIKKKEYASQKESLPAQRLTCRSQSSLGWVCFTAHQIAIIHSPTWPTKHLSYTAPPKTCPTQPYQIYVLHSPAQIEAQHGHTSLTHNVIHGEETYQAISCKQFLLCYANNNNKMKTQAYLNIETSC